MNNPNFFATKTGTKWYQYDIRNFSAEEYEKWYMLAASDKRKKVDRFQFHADKVRAIAGEMLAKIAISEWCNADAESVCLSAGWAGKPFAVGLSVEFNISHSENMVVCAVSDKPIGIDIEEIRDVDMCVIEQICTVDEKAYIMQSIDIPTSIVFSSELIRFFKVWTAKEAYFKCIGAGITNLGDVDVLHHIQHGGCKILDNYVMSIFQFNDNGDVD